MILETKARYRNKGWGYYICTRPWQLPTLRLTQECPSLEDKLDCQGVTEVATPAGQLSERTCHP